MHLIYTGLKKESEKLKFQAFEICDIKADENNLNMTNVQRLTVNVL